MNFLTDLDEIWYKGLPCNPRAQVFSVVQGGTFKPIDLKGGYEILPIFSKFFYLFVKEDVKIHLMFKSFCGNRRSHSLVLLRGVD
jgi:hypothetical protein